MNITAHVVKELREKTGAGMMDCKKALEECSGNIEESVEWLRKKGFSAAAKKAGRVASEGLIGVLAESGAGAVIEVNAETDFVSRNKDFQSFVQHVTHLALKTQKDLEDLSAHPYNTETSRTVEEEITQLIAVIGENLKVRRVQSLSVVNGVVASYIHGVVTENLGKIGVLVALESNADQQKLLEIGKKIAMHIAATNPVALIREHISKEMIEKERSIFEARALENGKPKAAIPKIVEGQVEKFYEESVLLEQKFVMDTSKKIGEYLQSEAQELGAEIKISAYVRFGLGEGLDKKDNDFASEVASLTAS